MKRREFTTLLGGAAVWPLAATAQRQTMQVIGYLGSTTPEEDAFRVGAFRLGLNSGGYVEGQNVAIEYRWAEGQDDRFPALAADLVRRNVDLIAAMGAGNAARAAKAASSTVPIVFAIGFDPVKYGLVTSFNRPSGNLTGISILTTVIVEKHAELLHEMVPDAGLVGFLVHPDSVVAEDDTKTMQFAAGVLGQRVLVAKASTQSELETAFVMLAQQHVGGLVVSTNQHFTNQRAQIVELAARHALPAIYPSRPFAAAGGLLSYGPDLSDAYRQCGVYAARILKGEKPSDLPIIQPTKFELVINLKVAKALRLQLPDTLLVRADEAIE